MIRVDRERLTKALRAVSEVWKSRDNNDAYYGHLRIRSSDGKLALSAYSMLIYIERTDVADTEEEFDVRVIGDVLKRFVDLQKEDLQFRISAERVDVRCGSSRLKLNTYDPQVDFPNIETPATEPSIILPPDILKDASRFLTRTVKDALAGRSLDKSVKMSIHDGQVYIASTDGPHLAVAKYNVDENSEFDAILDTALFESIGKAHDTEVSLYDLPNVVVSVSNNSLCRVPKMAGSFPPYIDLLNNSRFDVEFDIDRKNLSHATKTITAVSGTDCNTDFKINSGVLDVNTYPGSEGSSMGRSSHTIECEHTFNDIEMIVKNKDLSEVLDSCVGEKIHLMVESNRKFLMFKDDRGWLQVFSAVAL